ncbi:MAG TPA: ammonia channel protein, partial [Methylomirabilota bacterium]|nr:ammonia channel protein [Methylomirabilota bacterium]
HGVGGIVGALLTGVFSAEAIGGKPGLIEGNPAQLWAQAYGLVVTIAYGAAVSFAILKAIDWRVGLRVGEEVERDGLDLALHGETVA